MTGIIEAKKWKIMGVLTEGKLTPPPPLSLSLLVRKLDVLKEMNSCYLLRTVKLFILWDVQYIPVWDSDLFLFWKPYRYVK